MAITVKNEAKKVANPEAPKNEAKNVVPTSENEGSKKKLAKKESTSKFNLRTSKEVEFSVNGVNYKGTEFSVPEGSPEERKADLRANYGKDVVVED
jgi:hypothetical protein